MTYNITEIAEAFDRIKLITLDEFNNHLNDEMDDVFKLTILLNNTILVAELKKNLLKELNNKNGGDHNE